MPIKPNQVTLDLRSIAKQNYVRVTRISPQYDYQGGARTDKQVGLNYEVLLESNGFEKIVVRVGDIVPVIPPEQLAESNEPVYITLTDFEGKFYFSNHTKNFEVTAKASKAQLYKQPSKG